MPHATASGTWAGQADLGDFMLDVWLAFARDSCNWVDNQAPSVGTRPEVEMWTHRGTVPAPVSPFFMVHTKAEHLMIFTGSDVDLTQEIYDQPNNPAMGPRDGSFTVPASGNIDNDMRCLFVNTMTGPYDAYWLFADTTGEYIHCVVKVNSRQYRHFHIGRLRQIDGGPDLDPTSFYVTGHFWASLDPNALGYPTGVVADEELGPYRGNHQLPFRNFAASSQNGAFGVAMPNTVPTTLLYMPGLHPIHVTAAAVNNGGSGHALNDIITVSLTDGTYAGEGTAATLRVTGETGGVIDSVSVETAGDYDRQTGDGSVNPVLAIAQASTTGTGINATFDLTFDGWTFYRCAGQPELEISGSPAQKAGDGGVTTPIGDVMIRSRIGCAQSNAYDGGLGVIPFMCDRNFTANANVLIPIQISAAFEFGGDTRQGIVAEVPDVFRINMRDYAPEQEITVGSETYKVFPMINSDSQNTVAGEGYSGYDGLAYRVETGPVV